jgi:uncharacterized membrane protein
LGQVIEAIGSALGPLGEFFLTVIRVIFGLIVFLIGLVCTITPVIGLFVYLGFFTNDDFVILMSQFPFELFSNLVPVWLIIAASFLMIIPGIIIILLGLSVLVQKNLIGGRFGLVALGLWLLCVGISAFQIPKIVVQFKEENQFKTEEVIPILGRTMVLQLNPIGEESSFNQVNLKIEGTSDSLVTLKQEYFSRGRTKAEAMNNAKVITYRYDLLDSIVTFDEGFDISSIDTFRDQKLNLILSIPYEKPFIMERSLLEVLRNTIYRNGYRSSDLSPNTVWTFNQKGLVCLTCEDEKSEQESDEEIVISDSSEMSKQTRDSLSRVRYKDPTAVIL